MFQSPWRLCPVDSLRQSLLDHARVRMLQLRVPFRPACFEACSTPSSSSSSSSSRPLPVAAQADSKAQGNGSGASSIVSCRVILYPMLHLASRKFYDDILSRMERVCRRTDDFTSVLVLTEGVLEDEETREARNQEFRQIMEDECIRRRLEERVATFEFHGEEVKQDICASYGLPYRALREYLTTSAATSGASPVTQSPISRSTVRVDGTHRVQNESQSARETTTTGCNLLDLQDCYFSPLLAIRLGDIAAQQQKPHHSIRIENVDLTVPAIVNLYWKDCGGACGNPLVTQTLSELGKHRAVKAGREEALCQAVYRHVSHHLTELYRQQQEELISQRHCRHNNQEASLKDSSCAVLIPWGIHHTNGIADRLLQSSPRHSLMVPRSELRKDGEDLLNLVTSDMRWVDTSESDASAVDYGLPKAVWDLIYASA